ncbi:LOW QUALITY PROTEIN: reduced folate transporter [Alca torda]
MPAAPQVGPGLRGYGVLGFAGASGAMSKKDDDAKKPVEAALEQRWKLQVFCLCFFYGFMTQIRPESFITPYLLGDSKNFTQTEVTNVITPVLTYSYMAVLVPIFLLTDYLRYKPVLVLQSLSHISIWLLLVLGTSVLAMQLMEFFYGITMAARIAYSSYIFSLGPSRYQRMASYSPLPSSWVCFTSSVLGQLCVTLGGISFLTLNYISLGFVSFSLVLTLFLERPQRSLFFNRPEGAGGAAPAELDKWLGDSGGGRGWREAVLCRMLRELGALARQPLRLWSLWWVFNSAGYYLMLYYVHILWNEIYPTTDNRRVYIGVDAASTLLGWCLFIAGYVKIRWTLSELVIGVVTAFQAGLLLLMNTSNIWLCYAAYVFFRGSHQFLVPIAIFQIATTLELCALVFGVNTFFATVLKTIITIIVADKRVLGLSVHPQFYVYFGYFTLLAVVYLLAAVSVGIQHNCRKQPADLALAKEPCPLPAEVPVQDKSLETGAM